jgi:hypothetical protein
MKCLVLILAWSPRNLAPLVGGDSPTRVLDKYNRSVRSTRYTNLDGFKGPV